MNQPDETNWYDPTTDPRNLVDEFKGLTHQEIIDRLDQRGVSLEVAIENSLRDFNMGTIVRNANAFGVRRVHIIGSRQWNKRGAMATNKYLHICHHATNQAFAKEMQTRNMQIFAIENNRKSDSIVDVTLPSNLVMIFGQEGPGISESLVSLADKVVQIPQLGSTRSVNVGVASGIAMFEWTRRNHFSD